MSEGDKGKESDTVCVKVIVSYKELRHAEAVAGALAVDKDLRGCVQHVYRVDPTNNTMTAFVSLLFHFRNIHTMMTLETHLSLFAHTHTHNREFSAERKNLKTLRICVSSFFDMVAVANEAVENFDLCPPSGTTPQ